MNIENSAEGCFKGCEVVRFIIDVKDIDHFLLIWVSLIRQINDNKNKIEYLWIIKFAFKILNYFICIS